jgi:hypothetical protein
MTIAANSYGSTSDVAALTPRYADNVTFLFTTSTRPTLATVETQINQASGLCNSILAQAGFKIPVTQEDCKLALDIFVNEEVAAICEGINGSGRFGPTTKQPSQSRFAIIMDDLKAFVEANATGFENMGAERSSDTLSIGYAFSDYGNLFTRDQFGSDVGPGETNTARDA